MTDGARGVEITGRWLNAQLNTRSSDKHLIAKRIARAHFERCRLAGHRIGQSDAVRNALRGDRVAGRHINDARRAANMIAAERDLDTRATSPQWHRLGAVLADAVLVNGAGDRLSSRFVHDLHREQADQREFVRAESHSLVHTDGDVA